MQFKTWSNTATCASCGNEIKDKWKDGHMCHGCKKTVCKRTDCWRLWKYPWVLNMDLWEPEVLEHTLDKICIQCNAQAVVTVGELTKLGIRVQVPGAKDQYRAYIDSQSHGATSSGSLWGKFDVQENSFIVAVKRVMDAVYPGNRSWTIYLDPHAKGSWTSLRARSIVLPNIWHTKQALGKGQETLLDTLTGMAIHETGHAMYSSEKTNQHLERIIKQRKYAEMAAVALLNVTEDYYLESKIRDRFPTFTTYFKHTYNWALQETEGQLKQILKEPDAEEKFGARIAVATWEILVPGELARKGFQVPDKLMDLAQQCHQLLAKRLNEGAMQDTGRADVAAELYELLKTKELECTPECKKKQQKREDQFDPDCPVHGTSPEKLLINMLANNDPSNSEQIMATRKRNDFIAQSQEEIPPQNNAYKPAHQARINRLASTIQEMRKVLQLRNTQAAGKRTELRSGRINRRGLSRLSTSHQTNVFQQKLPEQYPKVRIGFMVDESGSMQESYKGTKAYEAARDACTAVAEAAKQIHGVKVWTWGFSNSSNSTSARGKIRRYTGPTTRSGHMIEMPLINGGTPTGPCMEAVSEVLIHGADQDEKIYCFVITDGYADSLPRPADIVHQFPRINYVHVGIGGIRDPGFPYYIGPVAGAAELPPLMTETVMQLLAK